ncbi:MAG: MATE family efflux transporter [Erysipelotrichaceae bacterium]|nr:MATE family efflux transporter [Erysipelotrichaceae bacterium]
MMMIFTSIYVVVDGFFVSNFGGKTAFAAVNLIFPVILIAVTPAQMLGAGGSALIAATLGEKKPDHARQQLSLLTLATAAAGTVLAVICFFNTDWFLSLLGCTPEMAPFASEYGRLLAPFLPFYMLQLYFQSIFVTAEKPQYGFYITLAAGLTNIILDYLLVDLMSMGVAGAAWASNAGLVIGAVLPLFYFMEKRSSPLFFGGLKWNGKWLKQACLNGCSEMLTAVSLSLVGILYNWQLLCYIGENGVSAYGVLMYVYTVFSAVFLGFTMGTAPILSYNYGAGRKDELKRLLKRSLFIILASSGAMVAACLILAEPLSRLFAGYDPELLDLTIHAFKIYAWSFLFLGLAAYGSGFFTALNDGLTSAVISFLRAMIFETGAVILLPRVFGVNGIWYSIVFAEFASTLLVILYLCIKRESFGCSKKHAAAYSIQKA